ncbi:unnamed protein product [Candidula unifasciata]|uniref:Carbohydrate sulfotransferase n=1 Tax=Candidula unifasciata TaxID=100452 RepID=A0A8S3YZR2_9EUPU|nr:unnamed protein product [Candidula unifasciata]
MRVPVRLLVSAVTVAALVPVFLLFSGSWRSKPHRDSAFSNALHMGSHVLTTPSEHSSTAKPHSHPRVSPEQWRNHIQTSCRKFGFIAEKDTFDPSILKNSKILVDDNNKLLYCQIPKVASTTWRRIFIVLSGKADTSDPMSLSANDVHHKFDKHLTHLRKYQNDEILYRLNNYFKFVFVREPFERILSAFKNKFAANTNSSIYFRKVFGEKIIDRYRQNPLANPGRNLTFEEFINYLTDPQKQIPMNEHWEKYYKLCHPCWIQYDFIGKLETLEEDSQYILEKNSLSEKVKVPSRLDSKYTYKKTNSYMHEYYSQIPKETLQKIFKMYYADFVIFNFTVPDSIKLMMDGH